MSDLKEAALQLAVEGTRVFPVGPDKAPRTPRGFHDATDDPAVIEKWNWNSDAMIGAVPNDDTIIVDVDPRNGGSETLKVMRAQGHTFPPTRVVRTMSGGFHYYFTVPEGAYRASLGPGIDVKRPGKGYVVVPPSAGYTTLSDGQAPAPAWLIEELRVEERDDEEGQASAPKFMEQFEDGTAYGLSAMEREVGRLAVAPEGERNNTLNRCAFALAQLAAGGELDADRARANLLEVADRIGLERREAELTLRSAWAAGEQKPRQAPEEEATPAIEPFSPQRDEGETLERRWVKWQVEEPPPPFYCNPFIPKDAYVLVYGPTEAAKSMVFVGLCAEASRRGLRCSIYSLENPPHTDRDRLRRLSPDERNFRLSNDPLDLNDPRQLDYVVQDETEWRTDIILIDTYSHAFNSRSEDGNAKAIAFAQRVRWIMKQVGCSVIVVDHTGFEGDEPRDASAKRQQVDVAILMRKSGEWQPGSPARFIMTNRKPARFANPFVVAGEIQDTDNRGLALSWERGKEPKWPT